MIALSMIVGGYEDPESLKRCLESVKGHVDQAFITITSELKDKKLKKVAEEMGAIVDYQPGKFETKVTSKQKKFIEKQGIKFRSKIGDRIFLFDKARNHSLEIVPKDYKWILWLDVDDILRGGDNLPKIIEEAERVQADSVFFNYIYQAEIVDGKIKNIMIEHLRERLIRNAGLYKWVAPIHETLVEQKPTRKIDTKLADVLHMSDNERMTNAIGRNIANLEYNVYLTKAKDPRPVYYLAKAYFDTWLNEQDREALLDAKTLMELYLLGEHKSGWAEERSQCWEYLVDIYRSLGDNDNAILCAHNAMIEDDRFPSIYVNLALCYVNKKEWKRAMFWVKKAMSTEQPDSTLVATPRDLMGRSLEVVYHASLNLSKLDEAWAAAIKLLEMYPNNPEMTNRVRLVESLKRENELTKLVVSLSKYLQSSGEGGKLGPLVDAIPQAIQDNPFMVDLMNKVKPPRKWAENEIAIFVGPCFTQWSPKSIGRSGGSFIGGSEEAVIYLSQELKKKGWQVTVFADPGVEEGMHDGVLYLPYFKWNKRDHFNIMVSWRRPDFVDQNFKASKTYIWCHDIQNQLDYTPERLAKITKVIVLSPWHRENIPNVPDEQILISGNGIQL